MRGHPIRSRAGVAFVVLLMFATVVSGCGAKRTVTDAYGWKASSRDATTLTVIVVTGVDDSDTRVAVVSQSDAAVVVSCSYRAGGGSSTANGVFRYVDVQLTAAIGDREVRNPDGSTVPEQKDQ